MFGFLTLMMALAGSAQGSASPGTDCANSYEPLPHAADGETDIALYASARRPMVMVSIAGKPYIPFAFDTGSSGDLGSLQVAAEVGLPENGPSPSVDGNGVAVPGFDTCLNGMVVGGVPVADRRATAFPFDRKDEEGIISPMLFSGSIVKFDGPARHLTILAKDTDLSGFGEARNWAGEIGNAHPVMDILIAGQVVEVRLDSGSDADLILPLEWMEKLPLKSKPTVIGEMQTASTSVPIYGERIDGDLTVGKNTYEDAFVVFAQTQTPLLGWPMMKTMRFYMDPDARVTWFE